MTDPAGSQAKPTVIHPGTQFYAPTATLLDDNSVSIKIPETLGADRILHPVNADIERAEITQTHHGAAQMSVTLSNHRHEKATQPRPIVPSWKYNRLDHIKFGQKMQVRFGYAQGAKRPQQTDSDLTLQENLMLRARITDMTFAFPSSGGAKVTLKGEDAISLLNTKPSKDTLYKKKDEIFMVKDVLKRSKSGLALAPEPELAPGTSETILTEPLRSITHSKNQSYYQFIEAFAKRLDYEIWVDIDKPNLLHFEKSRSLKRGEVLDLVWGKNLIDFSPKFKGWDVYTNATAGGSNPRRRSQVKELVDAKDIEGDLHTAPGEDKPKPMSAVEARKKFFSVGEGDSENSVSVDVSNLDKKRAKIKAIAELRRSAREFLTADASTIGFPMIRAGIHVNIEKLYAPFDGIYYVTQAIHTIDANGYRTKLKLRRPGMLNPSTYPGAASGGET